MNVLFFALKRAHQASLRPARQIASASGVTPARFDMLYALSQSPYGTRQSDLRRELGVSAPTVSRMLRSLESLGLVTRRRASQDTRQRIVELTSEGAAVVREVFEGAIDSDLVQHAVDSALADGNPAPDMNLDDMDSAESFCRRFRRAFRDTATLYYPYHPDD
jgi:DNA-binding MarR family transcriptional regulator